MIMLSNWVFNRLSMHEFDLKTLHITLLTRSNVLEILLYYTHI